MNARMLIFDGTVDVEPAFPPSPHDPHERDIVLVVHGWEARLFTGRKFEYVASRGLWHLQLWHPPISTRSGLATLPGTERLATCRAPMPVRKARVTLVKRCYG